VEALALAMPTGAFGVLEVAANGRAGRLTPLGSLVQRLAAGAGSARLAVTNADDAGVAALAHETEGGVALWLANLSPAPRTVAFAGFAPTRLQRLDGDTLADAIAVSDGFAATGESFAGPRLTLGPYAVARLLGESDAR
jgi:hypothetical protein